MKAPSVTFCIFSYHFVRFRNILYSFTNWYNLTMCLVIRSICNIIQQPTCSKVTIQKVLYEWNSTQIREYTITRTHSPLRNINSLANAPLREFTREKTRAQRVGNRSTTRHVNNTGEQRLWLILTCLKNRYTRAIEYSHAQCLARYKGSANKENNWMYGKQEDAWEQRLWLIRTSKRQHILVDMQEQRRYR